MSAARSREAQNLIMHTHPRPGLSLLAPEYSTVERLLTKLLGHADSEGYWYVKTISSQIRKFGYCVV